MARGIRGDLEVLWELPNWLSWQNVSSIRLFKESLNCLCCQHTPWLNDEGDIGLGRHLYIVIRGDGV